MQAQYFTAWQAISVIQVIWFVGAIAALGFTFFKLRRQVNDITTIRTFFLFYGLFTVFKTVGGILCLVILHLKTLKSGTYEAAYIFDSISVGFITRCLFPFIEYFYNGDKEEKVTKGRLHPFRILTLVLMIAIILFAVGATSSGDSGASTRKAGGILFIVMVLLLIAILIHLYFSQPQSRDIFWLLAGISALIFIRCVYTNVVAFNSDVDLVTKYSLLFGDYRYFLCLVLIIEMAISGLLLWQMFRFVRIYRI